MLPRMATVQLVLTILGGVCEVVGFSWTIAEASTACSREYGELGFFRRVFAWAAYWFGSPGEPKPLQASIGFGFGLHAGAPTISTFSGETDVERLQREIDGLRAEMERLHQHYEQKFENADRRVSELHAGTNQRIERLDQERKESRRIVLRREMRGAKLFMAGAVLTTIAAVLGIVGGSTGTAPMHVG